MGRFSQILSDIDSPPSPGSTNIQDKPHEEKSIDPRPDITSDHLLWVKVLTNAKEMFDEHKEINGGQTSLFKILHGIRCGGGQLEETQQAYKLHHGNEEWPDDASWQVVRVRWLTPVKDDLIELFRLCKIGQIVNEELPEGIFTTENEKKVEFAQERLFR